MSGKQSIVNLDTLVDTRVLANTDIQQYKTDTEQVALDRQAVETAVDGFDQHVLDEKQNITDFTETKKTEIETKASNETATFDNNATVKTDQFDINTVNKIQEYDANALEKTSNFDTNYANKTSLFLETYAGKVEDIIQLGGLLGGVYSHTETISDSVVEFPSTSAATYYYYKNGVQLTTPDDYTLGGDNQSLILAIPIVDGDQIIQIDTTFLQTVFADLGVVDNVTAVSTYADLPESGFSGALYIVTVDETNEDEITAYTWNGADYTKLTNTFTDTDRSNLDSLAAATTLAEYGITDADTTAEIDAKLATKQNTLVNQSNIKSINGDSILGSGNLEVSAGSGGYSANVYLTDENSTTNASYKQISYDLPPTQVVLTGVANNNTALIENFIFDGDVRTTTIPAGEWGFAFTGSVNNNAQTSFFRFEVFVRASGGIETVLFTVDSDEIDNTSPERRQVLTLQPSFAVNETDRVGIKVYAVTNRTSDTTLSFYVGDGEASYFVTPLEIRHNQLRARDDTDSHPIGAITGLQSALGDKADNATTLAGYGITDADTSAEVDAKIAAIVDTAPATLDTLNELAAALGDDANFSTTVTNQIATKQTILSEGVFVDGDKTKLDSIEANAKDDQVAGELPVTPIGNLSSTNAQLAFEELQSKIDNINNGEW